MTDMADPTYLLWAQTARRIPEDLVTPPPKPKPASDPFMDQLVDNANRNIRAARGWCAPSETSYEVSPDG